MGLAEATVTVAVLYVDPRGPYPKMLAATHPITFGDAAIDCWDEYRDARRYDGPHPVVAHPPCTHWGRLAHLAHVQCLACGWHDRAKRLDTRGSCRNCGSHRVTSDRYCAIRAVEQVHRFGGVLEHPAGSKLWEACGLTPPTLIPGLFDGLATDYAPLGSCAGISSTDAHDGYTVEVDQCEWGHVARKRTWLYLVGVPREVLETPPFPGRKPTHHVSRDVKRAACNGYTLKRCSSAMCRRTPPLFAEYLIRLARAARP